MRFKAYPLSQHILAICLVLAAQLASAQPQPTSDTPAPSERGARPALPSGWHASEFETPSRRYTLEIARFPSSALAGGVRMAMENMGWGPMEQVRIGGDEVVYLGNFSSVASATYAAKDLETQKLATARIVPFPQSLSISTMGINGPLLAPFRPTNPEDSRLISATEATRQVAMLADAPPSDLADPARLAIDRLIIESDWSRFGNDAGVLASELARLKVNPPLAFHLSVRVASGEWPSSEPVRIATGEIAADLLYGWLRDWRGAWAASQALVEDPARNSAGRARDRLRLAALEVELAASGNELRPDWNRVRLQLRRAWDVVPLRAEREQAKIELVYLQTFAWQGNWGRVEQLAKDFANRYGSRFPHETGLAKLHLAQSLERREAWDEALEMLDRHFAGRPLPPHDGLYMGFERLDLTARYRAARHRLTGAKIDSESEAINRRLQDIDRDMKPNETLETSQRSTDG